MICIARNKSKFYKRVLMDIWGQHFKQYKLTKLVHFRRVMKENIRGRKRFFKKIFLFSLANKIDFLKRKRLKKKYIKPRVLYNYYWTLSRTIYKKYLYKAKRSYGLFYRNYLTFIEGRLFMLVYRANFVSNLFKLKSVIENGFFWVDGIERNHPNFVVKVGEIIQVSLKYKFMIYNDMILRFNNNISNWISRDYLYINYKFLFIFFLRAPKINDFKGYPIKLDPYIGANLYFL